MPWNTASLFLSNASIALKEKLKPAKCWSPVDAQLLLAIKGPHHSVCPHKIFMTLYF